MLKAALNTLTRLHSRTAQLKRLGTPTTYSPCRITPSNYFRFLRGPEYSTIKGVEFILPVDSMAGHFAQLLSFSATPDSGTFKLKFGAYTTDAINYNANAAAIQAALRLLAPLSDVLVTGSFSAGFTITFIGFSTLPTTGEVTESTLLVIAAPVVPTWQNTYTDWTEAIKKGDRIIDGSKLWTVDEIIEMHDLGAVIMGYRCRCD